MYFNFARLEEYSMDDLSIVVMTVYWSTIFVVVLFSYLFKDSKLFYKKYGRSK